MSAPMTVRSTSPRTAAPPGAPRAASPGCPPRPMSPSSRRRSTTPTRSSPPSTTTSRAISRPMSSEAMTGAGAGSRSAAICPIARSPGASSQDPSTRTSSSSAPSSVSTSPSTAARTGSPIDGRSADHRGARARDPAARERSRPGHLRSRFLHPRRLHAAARRSRREPGRGRCALPGQGPALRYIETSRLGLPTLDKAFQGDSFYTAPNPPFGAVFTYHLKDGLKTRQERRLEAEKKADEKKTTLPYPSSDDAPRRGRGARPEHRSDRQRRRRSTSSRG